MLGQLRPAALSVSSLRHKAVGRLILPHSTSPVIKPWLPD